MVRKELMQVELAGVLIAVLLLIFLIYKRLSLIPATLICVAVLALTNGFSYMDLFINHYGVSLAGFVGKYFLYNDPSVLMFYISLLFLQQELIHVSNLISFLFV